MVTCDGRMSKENPLNFEELHLDRLVLAGVRAAGYEKPTPIQEQAIPIALEGRDVLGMAQTGTGKTAAFMLPILQRLITGPTGTVRALIIAPTRELAEQIHQSAVDLGRSTQIRSVSIYGGVNKRTQAKRLNRGVEIVVACPGRLLDHLNDRAIDLSRVELLVLDEADTMCDMGFLPDIRRILTYLPERRQTMFFAATMPDEIRALSNEILNDPTTVQIGISAPATTVSHALYPVTETLKKRLLMDLLRQTATGRVMIFTRTKHRARRLAGDLENANYRVAALQGNMTQNRRQQSIDGFRDGKYDVLVATDLASRGIDVSLVSHVINFDMPNTVDPTFIASGAPAGPSRPARPSRLRCRKTRSWYARSNPCWEDESKGDACPTSTTAASPRTCSPRGTARTPIETAGASGQAVNRITPECAVNGRARGQVDSATSRDRTIKTTPAAIAGAVLGTGATPLPQIGSIGVFDPHPKSPSGSLNARGPVAQLG